jgi:UDP-2,3-diacylglucosamine pyrophosphatase LpxH
MTSTVDKTRVARRIIVLSDSEIGVGGPADDFPFDTWFGELLCGLRDETPQDVELVLVFNGDTFDFLKAPLRDEANPRLITEEISIDKLDRMADVHGDFFQSLGAILKSKVERTRALFVVGNHDFDLIFPKVQTRIRELLGFPDALSFVGEGVLLGDAWIEHGSQEDTMFRFDFDKPTVDWEDDEVLNLPWGAVGLIDVALPVQHLFAHHDRMRPRGLVFELMPELRELLVGLAWRYWSREYLRRWFSRKDPLAQVNWRMFREIGWRLGTANASLSVQERYRKRLREGDARLMVIGHEHEACWYTWSDRKLLTTGCLRAEYALSKDGKRETLLPAVFAELLQDEDGLTIRSQLLEVATPLPWAGWKPDSVFDVLPAVRTMLAKDPEAEAVRAEIEAEESQHSPETG